MIKLLQNKIRMLAFCLLVSMAPAVAQDGNPLQFLRDVSQSAISNPAFQNRHEKLVVGLPIFGGATFDWNANFAPDYIFSKNFSYSFGHFYEELGQPGNAASSLSVPVLYFSLQKKKRQISFSVAERVFTKSDFDHEILRFIDEGIKPYYNNSAEFGPLSVKAYHYRELAVGYSAEVWDGLTIGIRPKILFGRFYYHVSDLHLSVETNPQKRQLLLRPLGSYLISAPLEISYNEELGATSIRPNPAPSDYFFKFRNLSPAIDLGLTYQFETQTELAVSLLDLGYVGFKHNTWKVDFVDALRFSEDELYQSNNPATEDADYTEAKIALQKLNDGVPYIISARKHNERIVRQIPLKLIASVKQPFANGMEAGLQNQYTSSPDHTYNYLTGHFSTPAGIHWRLLATVSLYKLDKVLPGIGASYTGKWAQFFVATNNLTALVKPSTAKSLNLSLGVNFLVSTFQN